MNVIERPVQDYPEVIRGCPCCVIPDLGHQSDDEDYPVFTDNSTSAPESKEKDLSLSAPEPSDLTGWSVKIGRGKRLRPLRQKKLRAPPPPESVEWLQSQPHLMTPETVQAREWLKGRKAIEELLAQAPPGVAQSFMKPLSEAKRIDILEKAKLEINEVEKSKGEWEPVEMTVDSGAADTVCPIEAMERIVADLENATEEGFIVADGTKIPNMGAKEGVIATQEWSTLKGVSFQVAPVHKTLLSVSKMVENGHRVVFDKDWSYIEDLATGEKTTLICKNGLYVLRAWVRPRKKVQKTTEVNKKDDQSFQRQGP